MLKYLILTLLVICTLSSCNDPESTSRKRVHITSPEKASLGSPVILTLDHVQESDSLKVFLGNKQLSFTKTDSNKITLSDFPNRMGDFKIKVKAYFDGKASSSNQRNIRVYAKSTFEMIDYTIINTYKHDKTAYTQGLKVVNDIFYESTGLFGKSDIRKVNINSGEVIEKHSIEEKYFAEGLAVFGDSVFQLTWQGHNGFIYSRSDLKLIGNFQYQHEGWGMDADDEYIYVSDGSATIRVWNPSTLKTVFSYKVRSNNREFNRINELEVVGDYIWANVYTEDIILKIDKHTGEVAGLLNLADLYPHNERDPEADVLNGIAHNATDSTFYITGKLWPKLYEIRLKN